MSSPGFWLVRRANPLDAGPTRGDLGDYSPASPVEDDPDLDFALICCFAEQQTSNPAGSR